MTAGKDDRGGRAGSLIESAGVADDLALDPATEHAWIEVIHRMDQVYADLVRYQVELEEKNGELEEAYRFIHSVLGAMTDVLIVCDARGRIQQVNAALEALVGRRSEALEGTPFQDLVAAESRETVSHFGEHLRAGVLTDCEVAVVDRDGQPAPLAMNCSPRCDHHGRVVGLVLIGRPVGELRRAYEDLNRAHRQVKDAQRQLVHSEKMASLGRLVAGVAHELNNPISFVFGNMHALRRYGARIARYLEADPEGAAPEDLKRIREELKIDQIIKDLNPLIDGTLEGAERVSDIVQDLRRFSATQQEAVARLDLPEVMHTAVKWVGKAARAKPEVDFGGPDHLYTDSRKGHVQQILVNLVQNALDVMEDQETARLDLACGEDGGGAWVTVRDHGPGIPEAEQARIFDPFYTTKPVGKGTGLGLYISYGLAGELGGDLEVANHPDGGAVFTLRLPAAAP